ncbi:hypothetical protein EB796_005062 [Bugula neritina]|uniref:C2 domain-containing protein n=1 Tax=Bugula neritina TaxID=10212 RepID=A0A7J7KEG2_BUGNE|nr:hypothetical protein EB796_005062 [Bugula neritina]
MAFRLMLEASQGHGMAGVKEWLQTKFSSMELVQTVNRTTERRGICKTTSALAGVITPDTVPDFVIPSASLRAVRGSKSLDVVNNNHSRDTKSVSYGELSTIPQGRINKENSQVKRSPFTAKFSTHNKYNNVKEVLPAKSSGISRNRTDTDDIPQLADVSVPHLKTNTPYGFTTLLESPHTLRKESLLLGSASFDDVKKFKNSFVRRNGSPPGSTHHTTLSVPVTRVHSLSNSSTSILSDLSVSPLHSPLLSRSISSATPKKKYNRRRSSAQSQPIALSESDGSTSEDVFQPDSSQPTAEMSKGEARDLAVLGEIKLSLLYSRQDESLRLIIIKAEDLGKHVPTTPHINSFIKVCMLPHKSHRHESLLVRGTRNPHYNQEFTLKNISISNLKEYHLRLRVCNRIASRKYETLGEVILPLQTLGLEHEEEVRMWRDLDPKSMYQDLGELNVAIKFEPREDSLQIRVNEISGLPKYALTGLPDTYVKVIVRQDGKSTVKKQTKLRKNTSHPVYNETFAFSISPKIDDLRYTSIALVVLNHQTIRTDTVIGEVLLGYGSTTDDEYIHWSNILNSTNHFVQYKHQLKPPSKHRLVA